MLRIVVATAALLGVLTTQAEARSTPYKSDLANEFSGDRYTPKGAFPDVKPVRREAPAVRCSGHGCKEAKRSKKRTQVASKGKSKGIRPTAQIVAHPEGCRTNRFCGCGTSKYLLGKVVNQGGLAVASAWLKFPRATCAPRMAAARHGHVFAIIECLSGNKALVYDPNSGRRQTRIHVRSLAGYTVVNPHGSRVAEI